MKLHLPRRRIWRVAIYATSLLLVLLAIDQILVQVRRTIHPGFSTTRITAPLLPDGSVDYLIAADEAYGAGVTPDNNAAVLVLQAMGRKGLASDQPTDGITDRMGMPHLPEQGNYLIGSADFLKQHGAKEDSESDTLQVPTWTSRPPPIPQILQDWVRANEKPLDLFVEASRRTHFYIPFYAGYRHETMAEIMLPYLAPMRDADRALMIRARMRLEAGNIAGFQEDLIAGFRLSRVLGQETTLIDRLVALNMENGACRATRAAAASGRLSRENLMQLIAALGALPKHQPLIDAMNKGERYLTLQLMQAAAKEGPKRAGELFAKVFELSAPTNLTMPVARFFSWPAAFRLVPMDYEETMKVLNRYYDGVIVINREPTYARREAAIALLEEEIDKMRSGSMIGSILSPTWPFQMLVPEVNRLARRETATAMENQLSRIALALAAFKLDHHSYPQALPQLVPEYLSTVPNDEFVEKPFVYARTAGGYSLYSVGPNKIDDKGNSQPVPALPSPREATKASPPDDINASVSDQPATSTADATPDIH